VLALLRRPLSRRGHRCLSLRPFMFVYLLATSFYDVFGRFFSYLVKWERYPASGYPLLLDLLSFASWYGSTDVHLFSPLPFPQFFFFEASMSDSVFFPTTWSRFLPPVSSQLLYTPVPLSFSLLRRRAVITFPVELHHARHILDRSLFCNG